VPFKKSPGRVVARGPRGPILGLDIQTRKIFVGSGKDDTSNFSKKKHIRKGGLEKSIALFCFSQVKLCQEEEEAGATRFGPALGNGAGNS